ncbi:MAG TPA: FG-GAP repeat protein, partial [bacterium]|nr:FG-GAP repeat protein [bacterium]
MTSDREDQDEVGRAVDMDGETILMGAPEEDEMGTRSGAAYIFKWYGGTWVQEVKLMAPDGVSGAQFGYAVSLSDEYALVGAFRDSEHGNQAGAAYLWHRVGGSWQYVQKLVPAVPLANIEFGNAVAINGDYAVIGAHRYEHMGNMTGGVYVF